MYIEHLTRLTHNSSSTNAYCYHRQLSQIRIDFSIVHGCIVQWRQVDFASDHGLTS